VTGIAVVLIAAGLIAGWPSASQWSAALLGALLLARNQDRLLLAPLYGAGLLLVIELAQRSLEIRGHDRLGSGVTTSRLAAILVAAALGLCAAALAALAVTRAPPHSVALTALATIAALSAFAAIALLAHRDDPRRRETRHQPTATDGGTV
jgi:hypothetical protein